MFAVMTKHNKSISLGLIRKQREAAGRQKALRDEEEEEEKDEEDKKKKTEKDRWCFIRQCGNNEKHQQLHT